MAHMGLRNQAPTDLQVIRKSGIFDFQGAYQYIYDWLKNRHYEYHEKRHKTKRDSALGYEVRLDFSGTKRVTEFVKYEITFNFHLWDTKDIEAVVDGKKKQLSQGRLELQMQAAVHVDWQKRYDLTNPIQKAMYYLLVNHILNRELLVKHFDVLEDRMHVFEDEIRKVLDMVTHEVTY